MNILDSTIPPGENFNLSKWRLNIPAGEGNSRMINSTTLQNGYESEYFYTADDGGLVCMTTAYGPTTKNAKYTRCELREVLNESDDSNHLRKAMHNWVTSSYPQNAQEKAGAVNGTLTAELAVNRVSTTGNKDRVGKIVIGQIKSYLSIPVRLVYRLLPGHNKGSLYFYHRQQDGNGNTEICYPLVGKHNNDAIEPFNGIELNERFKYVINAQGNELTVVLFRANRNPVTVRVDMKDSGYKKPYIKSNGKKSYDYMYFKAGVYNQNNSADIDDYVQATFYQLTIKH